MVGTRSGPAALLGALGQAPYYIKEGPLNVSEEIVTSFTGALAFYLYVMVEDEVMTIYIAYAEEVAAEAERGSEDITIRGVLGMLGRAIPLVPSIIVASVAAITLPIAATSLLRPELNAAPRITGRAASSRVSVLL